VISRAIAVVSHVIKKRGMGLRSKRGFLHNTQRKRKIDMYRPSYHTHIKSNDWYAKHPVWLKAVVYRCSMFPWIKIGRGRKYRIHHLHYRNLGNERLRRDVVPLCPFAHDFIIHGMLSGFRSAGKQKRYPNLGQRIVHLWCVQRLWIKVFLLLVLVALLIGRLVHLYLARAIR